MKGTIGGKWGLTDASELTDIYLTLYQKTS